MDRQPMGLSFQNLSPSLKNHDDPQHTLPKQRLRLIPAIRQNPQKGLKQIPKIK
jgi:hypothetical protein